MYARSASIVLLALPLLASAAAFRRGAVAPSGSCDFDSIMCCDTAEQASSSSASSILSLLGINAGSVTGLVGINCNPITVVGISGTSCTSQPVCCSNNTFKGVVALGCNAISL